MNNGQNSTILSSSLKEFKLGKKFIKSKPAGNFSRFQREETELKQLNIEDFFAS